MNKSEWQQIGEDIKKQVQHAIDTNDFSELSKSIGETVNLAASDVSKSLNDVGKSINDIGKSINDAVNDAAGSFQKGMQQTSAHGYTTDRVNSYVHEQRAKNRRQERAVYYRKPNLRPDPKLFNNTPPGSVSGLVWMVLGFGAMGISCLAAVQGALGILTGVETVTALALPITAATAGGVVGTYGASVTRRVERFRRYVDIVKDKLYCSVEDMAGKIGKSKRYVRRDLKRMMRKGMFLQAHLDKKETCFIASDAMYEQYQLTQKQYEQAQLEEKAQSDNNANSKKQIETDTIKTENADSRVTKVLEEGREYIRVIRKCNDEIPGEEMSEKLDKLELLVTRIFARVEEEPELASDMQKMLNYYLPTTQKLLEAYRDLDKQDVELKNISETKQEIEKTVDTINRACEEFLDELFRDRAWDIQSDITVLNTMLKQDGYIKSDFDKGEKES